MVAISTANNELHNQAAPIFRYIGENRTFGRAAEACSISQPALSLQIKELETMFDAPLVERTSRQIKITTLGEEFLIRARKILIDVDELSELARSSQGSLEGTLRMGVIPTIAPYFLPAIIRGLGSRVPELELQLREAVTQSLIEDLLQFRLDFVIAALPISEPALQEFALFEEDFVLVRSSEDADKPVPNPEDLQGFNLLLLEEGHCFREQAIEFCKLKPSERNLSMEGSSLSTLVQMVSAGLGLTLIPEMAMDLETRSASVSVSSFINDTPKRTIGMVWRKTNPLAKQLMELAAHIRQIGQGQQSASLSVET